MGIPSRFCRNASEAAGPSPTGRAQPHRHPGCPSWQGRPEESKQPLAPPAHPAAAAPKATRTTVAERPWSGCGGVPLLAPPPLRGSRSPTTAPWMCRCGRGAAIRGGELFVLIVSSATAPWETRPVEDRSVSAFSAKARTSAFSNIPAGQATKFPFGVAATSYACAGACQAAAGMAAEKTQRTVVESFQFIASTSLLAIYGKCEEFCFGGKPEHGHCRGSEVCSSVRGFTRFAIRIACRAAELVVYPRRGRVCGMSGRHGG
jgi:hypothetical protein